MKLTCAAFSADITPPLSSPLECGHVLPVASVEHNLLAKGVILSDETTTAVLCSLDWAGLGNAEHLRFRQEVADALSIPVTYVAIRCVHQHTAPAADQATQDLLDGASGDLQHTDRQLARKASAALASAAAAAAARQRPVSRVDWRWAEVDQVASSRRVRRPDGRIVSRWSSAREPEMQMAPEGLIDGFLRSVVLEGDGGQVACLHYYATHPQSFYHDGRVTYDVPGIARESVQEKTGVPQIYFTGCSGNITMGKYNRGTREDRTPLVSRVQSAMERSLEAATFVAAGPPVLADRAAASYPQAGRSLPDRRRHDPGVSTVGGHRGQPGAQLSLIGRSAYPQSPR